MNQNEVGYEEQAYQYQQEYAYDSYMDNLDNYGMDRRTSSTGQLQIKDLLKQIQKQVQDIQKVTNFTFDWAILLYHACAWNTTLCNDYILDEKQKHKQIIKYNPQFQNKQGFIGLGDCDLCGESNVRMLRNLCGHQFCQFCWKGHLDSRLTQYNKPFPPCILGQQNCPIKMSYTLCEYLGSNDSVLHDKYIQALCRSYASYNSNVKICHGKKYGKPCKQCFTIKQLYQIIQCNNCGSIMCPRCGEKAHGYCICFQLKNWKQLSQSNLDFVQFLDYKICPHCKEGVNRSQGCNYMACKCGQAFCFYCGDKFQPHHKVHSSNPKDCPNHERVQQLLIQKQMRKKNKQQFFNKIQQRKSKLDAYCKQQQRIQHMKIQLFPQIKKVFLKNFAFYQSKLQPILQICSFVEKAYCVLWGESLSTYFVPNQQRQFKCDMIKAYAEKAYDFLVDVVERKYKLLLKSEQERKPAQNQQLKPQKRIKFVSQFQEKLKQMEQFKQKTEKLIIQLKKM